jgi:hypothetical protein
MKNLHSNVPLLAVLTCMAACGSNGGHGTEGAVPQPDDLASGSSDLTIDAAATELDIPATYVGMALSRAYISGDGNSERLFNPSWPRRAELINLLHEIGVKHIRVLSDGALDLTACTSPFQEPDAGQDADFFSAAAAAGLGSHSVIYSLHLFNEEGRSDNVKAVDHLAAAPYTPMIESFAFDNEPDWEWLYQPNPCFDPNVPDRAAYFKAWNARQADVVKETAAIGGATVPFSGPDTGSSFPVGTDDTGINGEPFTLAFAQSHDIALATQHHYGGSTRTPPAG